MTKHVIVIGAGFGGMSAAAYLARAGYQVTVLEKNAQPGGRAGVLERDGFVWDLGPSWYMMPDVFEEFFRDFGHDVSDFYTLKQLEPSYRVFNDEGDPIDVGTAADAIKTFEAVSPGAGVGLQKLLAETEREYASVRKHLLGMEWLKATDALEKPVLDFLRRPSMIASYDARISAYVKDTRLKHILEFMTVFMGGSPQNIPGMYSMLSYVDMGLGIWYPMGGFGAVARGFEALCKSLGVAFQYEAEVAQIITSGGKVKGVRPLRGEPLTCDIVVANADYQHVQTKLLNADAQDIPAEKWVQKTLSPSGLVVCLGVKKRLPKLQHHNLFFDTDWDKHFTNVFTDKQWSADPLFYLCVPSRTDPGVAPKGSENMFVLAPQANGDEPSQEVIDETVDNIIARIEAKAGTSIASSITAKEVLAQDYFKTRFNAYRGNAFGLAHTLTQSALFRPRLKAKKVSGLYFAGQYTNPGTGVPMVVLSGKTVAGVISKYE